MPKYMRVSNWLSTIILSAFLMCSCSPEGVATQVPVDTPCHTSASAFTVIGTAAHGAKDGDRSTASFFLPSAMVADAHGSLYVADTGNSSIRKIAPDGQVTTIAGSSGEAGFVDGIGKTARFFSPTAIAIDSEGNLYVADNGNQSIRKVTPSGVVTTLAGGSRGKPYFVNGREYSIAVAGWNDGKGSLAQFNNPRGIAVDHLKQVYVADSGSNLIRKISPDGEVSTIAGRRPGATSIEAGYVDGQGAFAKLNGPEGLAVDNWGSIYFTDNNAIRKIGPDGIVTTLAGGGGRFFTAPRIFPSQSDLKHLFPVGSHRDGTGTGAEFAGPRSLTVDPDGNVFVAQVGVRAIRKVSPAGTVTTSVGPDQDLCSILGPIEKAIVAPLGIAILPGGHLAFLISDTVIVQN
jgi:streptogramin lyase